MISSVMRLTIDRVMHIRIEDVAHVVWQRTCTLARKGHDWLVYLRERPRRRRIAAGDCPQCGYHLRGSIWTCPECGAQIPKAALLNYLIIEGKPPRNFANTPRHRKPPQW